MAKHRCRNIFRKYVPVAIHRFSSKLKSIFVGCLCGMLFTIMINSLNQNDSVWQRRYQHIRGRYFDPGKAHVRTMKLDYQTSADPKELIIGNMTVLCHSDCKYSISKNEILPTWQTRNLIKHSRHNRYIAFDQVITTTEYNDMIDILQIFKSVCQLHNLTFMLYGGSLLGAYRHFGLIPWDDDIDVLMNASEAHRVRDALRNVPGFSVDIPYERQWKFYRTNASKNNENCCTINNPKVKCQCPNWPYIDIFFFYENDTHIWDYNKEYSDVYCYLKDDVFPLTGFLFENSIMPVPRKIRKALDKSYNVELCVTLQFSHRAERPLNKIQTVPCKRLFSIYPFVFEIYTKETVIRSLIFADKTVVQTILDAFI